MIALPDAGSSDDSRGGYGDQQTVNLVIGGTDYGNVPAQITLDNFGYNFDLSSYTVQAPVKSEVDVALETVLQARRDQIAKAEAEKVRQVDVAMAKYFGTLDKDSDAYKGIRDAFEDDLDKEPKLSDPRSWENLFVYAAPELVFRNFKGLFNGELSNAAKLVGSLDGLTVGERTIVNDLIAQGKNVNIIPRSNVPGVQTVDFAVNGVKTELKTLSGTSLNTPIGRIQDAFKQGAEVVIIDARNVGLTKEQAEIVLKRAAGTYPEGLPGKVQIWTQWGIIE